MTLIEAEEASEIVNQAAGHGVNIWLGTSIDDSLKDEIRVTVVATGVRKEKADKVAGFRSVASSIPQPNQQPLSRPSDNQPTGFERRPSYDFDMAESHDLPDAEPRQPKTQAEPQQTSAFGDWDLRRESIARPSEGELDSKLSMSSYSKDDDDDELETPPFFKNR